METKILNGFDFSTFNQEQFSACHSNIDLILQMAKECIGYKTKKLKLIEIARKHNRSYERVRQILIAFQRVTKYYKISV